MAVNFAASLGNFLRNCLIALGIVLSVAAAGTPRGVLLETDGKFTEFPLPNPNSGPTTVSIANDGTLWFTESMGNRMGRITAAGVITEFDIPTPNSQPRATALSTDGNVWFGEFAGGKIGRITPAGVITEFR